MAKQNKAQLFEKETKYCKIMRSVTVEDGEERFAIEKYMLSHWKGMKLEYVYTVIVRTEWIS